MKKKKEIKEKEKNNISLVPINLPKKYSKFSIFLKGSYSKKIKNF